MLTGVLGGCVVCAYRAGVLGGCVVCTYINVLCVADV